MHDHTGGAGLHGLRHRMKDSGRRRRLRFGILMWGVIGFGAAAAVAAASGRFGFLPAAGIVLTLVIGGCLLLCVFAAWAGGREARAVERTVTELSFRRRGSNESRRQT